MPYPDEGLIHAWLDGELDADEAARIEALVANDPAWAAAAAEARGLIAASSRIVGALDQVPAHVIPKTAPAPRRLPWWTARAAALVLVVAGAAVVWERAALVDERRQAPDDSPASTAAAMPATRAAEGDAAARAVSAPPPAKTAQSTKREVGGRQPVGDLDRLSRKDEAKPADALRDQAAVADPSAPRANALAAPPLGAAAGAAAVDTHVPRVTCYRIIEGPIGQPARAPLAFREELRARDARAERAAALVAPQVLALTASDSLRRQMPVLAQNRPTERMPVSMNPDLPLQGQLKKEYDERVLVTWHDANRAITARADARGDSLVGTASVEGQREQAFRAVRVSCPAP